jgi:predicted nucleic acid-binding protein
MIVVADTSPLNYLVLIDEIDLLRQLFGVVLLPAAVLQELKHPKASTKVRAWAEELPGWIEVCAVQSVPGPLLLSLDLGEREALQLAIERNIDTILMDEAAGRMAARALRIEVRGTLGILERGGKLGFIDFDSALIKLEETSFRLSPAVRSLFLRRKQLP